MYIEDELDRHDTEMALMSMHLQKAWGFRLVDKAPECEDVVVADPVLFFNDYQFYGNYYHFTYDALLPLFRQLQLRGLILGDHSIPKGTLILPAQQTAWRKSQDWSTEEFQDSTRFHMNMLTSLFPGQALVPVDARAASRMNGACFSNASFGTPFVWDDGTIDQSPVPFSSGPPIPMGRRELLKAFADFVRASLGLVPRKVKDGVVHIAVISRKERRKISNEELLMEKLPRILAVEHPQLSVVCELMDFNGMTYRDQVAKVGDIDVLVGMNGAGLINALYTNPDAVVVQLLPHGSNLNFDEFRSILRAVVPPSEESPVEHYSSRDHYMEWKNSIAENAVQPPNQYQPFDNEDTTVNEDEFFELMRRAVTQIVATRSLRRQEMIGYAYGAAEMSVGIDGGEEE